MGAPGTPRTGHAYLDAVLGQPGSALALAHRGGALHPDLAGLENTLKAFQHAVGLGYAYLETDVHVTSDGVLLAIHDESLDRVSDGTGAISEHTHDEVRRARINGTEPIPTLAELVEALPDARFNVDLKAAGAVSVLVAFVAEHDLWQRICVGSFSRRRIRAFRRLTGHQVATAAHPLEVLAFRLLPGWLARRVAGDFDVLQVPHRQGPLRLITPGVVRRAHRAGKQVHAWTIDDPQEMQELLDRGVDGIFTDRTDVLKDVLVARGQWWHGA